MIELKNIVKNYKSKKGRKTKALDNVSISFDDKGMTFILGKSGSGKSTLLNVLGGLDKYDEGEMLILGKSSKDFSSADFDSYRNTYIGFIFQEFNILEDYDVYENIALALELQHKEADDKKIDELLEKLDLKNLKNRKINELSGGQKQRVAIARALIKNPRIILADEPTGNLDSATGKEVMNLLKEIAKEKLVIIVSHDEEFATKYGDRIIEIKDGQIIKDTKEVKLKKTENTYEIVKSHLPIKRGFKLGLGSLKHKKIKLFFTVLLTVITLGFFSCTDTLSDYSANREHVKKLVADNEKFVQIEKYHNSDNPFFGDILLSIDDNTLNKIKEINGDGYEVYKFYNEYSSSLPSALLYLKHEVNSYSSDDEAELVVTSDVKQILDNNIIGKSALEGNEIIISNKVADMILEEGINVHEIVTQNEFKTSNLFEPKTYEEILNTNYTYHFGEKGKVKIVGIIEYDEINYNKNNIANKIYISKDFFGSVETNNIERLKSYFVPVFTIENVKPYSENIYTNQVPLNKLIEYYDGNTWQKTDSLKENEVIISLSQIIDSNEYNDAFYEYQNRNIYEDYDVLQRKFFANYVNELNVIGKKANLKIYYGSYGDKDSLYNEYNDLTIVGVYNDNYSYENNNYFSSSLLDEYKQNAFERVSILYPMTKKQEFKKVLQKFSNSDLSVKTTYSKVFAMEEKMFNAFKKVAFVIGIVFLSFTIMLIGNFIITSINYRKKEIGILRALGASSIDVAKIFLWEGIILSLISGTVASILLVIVTNFVNNLIMTELSILSTPFAVTIRQFAFIYILVFMVTIISSILPIIRISKMKPVDAILNK